MSKVVSARLDDSYVELLQDRARRASRKQGELVALYLKEGLLVEEYPGIVFVEGPAGRRAHLAGTGLDVWEIAMLLEDGVTEKQLQNEYAIKPGLVNSVVRYAADYPDDIAAFMPPKK